MGVVLALRGGGGLSIPSSASPSDVISLLHRERASQDTWVDVAKAFLLHGNTDVYQAVLQGLVAQATGSAPEPVTFPVLQAHCALAAWHSHRGRNNRSIARAAFDEASTLLLNARNRALDDALPLLCMGQLALDKVKGGDCRAGSAVLVCVRQSIVACRLQSADGVRDRLPIVRESHEKLIGAQH